MLFDPARHEPLNGGPWDADRVRERIRAMADDALQARRPDGQWPVHPLDHDGDDPPGGFKSLYLGSAGVLWTLWTLQRRGLVATDLDFAATIRQIDADYQAAPDTGQVVPSFFLGEVGIDLIHWRITGSPDVADRLFAAVEANIPNPTNEALWAAPGTMVAAWHLWVATAEPRWRDLLAANIEQLWRTWTFDPAWQCHLWTQDLYGQVVQYLGAGHGFAGNAAALLQCASLLDDTRRAALHARCLQTLQAFVHVDSDAANWPPGTFATRPGRPAMLMQWCHGAPGFITGLAHVPVGESDELDRLLLAAGQAVWQAGPLAKGAGLCHGTAGNGAAFLVLYRRTGDPLWLERARAFAMHALAQADAMRRQHGHGRHTLWTGDPGVALHAAQCLDGTAGMPGLDVI